MRKLRKAIPLALAMSVALTMTPIRASAEEPTQVQAEQSDLVEENESLSDEADKDNEGYKLVFEDDFNGDQLDRKVWNVEKHEKGWVNGELQEYVDSDENIKVQDGYLNIIPVEKVETTSTTDGQNLLSNADFSSGMDDWTETIANWGSNGFDAAAQSSVADGAITYTITNPGNDLWHVQLKQTVKLAAKKHYTLSYKVKSDLGCGVCVCDRDQIIAVAGISKKDLLGKSLHRELEDAINDREAILARKGEKKFIRILGHGDNEYDGEIVQTIICEGDAIGAVILLSREGSRQIGESEVKAAAIAAKFLGKQMEG